MASTQYSPLNWKCPYCQQTYTKSNTSLLFLRGSCHRDICSDCIAKRAREKDAKKRDGKLIEVSCPLNGCRRGIFCMERLTTKIDDNICSEVNAKEGQINDDDIDELQAQHVDALHKSIAEMQARDQDNDSRKRKAKKITVGDSKKKHGAEAVNGNEVQAKSNLCILKPIFDVGDEVYAAWCQWWHRKRDRERAGQAAWYPGRVKAYNQVGHSIFGPIRLYDIEFDDGDKIESLNDYWIFPKDDYILKTEFDKTGRVPVGVKEVFDLTSSDKWAKMVGWYAVVIDGKEQTYSRLSDAMKAHDAHVVHIHGDNTTKSHLNLPKDYPWLFEEVGDKKLAIKQEFKEDTDDDSSRFSGTEDERVKLDKSMSAIKREFKVETDDDASTDEDGNRHG